MRKLTQKLVLSVVTMALVVIALGTSTFAWFTLTDTAKVDTFNAEVQAGNGILVSLDNVNFYTVIDSTTMNAFLVSKYGVNGTQFNLKDRTSKEGRIFLDRINTPVTDGYIEFDLFFRSDSALNINVDGVVLSGGTKSWTPDVDFVGASGSGVVAGTPITVNAYDAARVSVTGLLMDGNALDAAPESGSSTTFIYKTSQTETFGDLTKGAVAYWNAVNTGTSTDITTGPNTTDFAAAIAAKNTGASGLADQVITLTETGSSTGIYKGAVRVRVWIEGWDADAYNSIFDAALTVMLQFKRQ